jgi:hypothetical protein
MGTFKIRPILGRKTDVPADDPSLFVTIGQDVALTYDTGGINVDYNRTKDTCTKSMGYSAWSNSAVETTQSMCHGLYELDDGTNRDNIIFETGRMFYYDGTPDPVLETSGVTFADSIGDLYSVITFGSYLIFSDVGEHTPYKWSNGDAAATKLILSGTEYKFRYLAEFQNRIIGAYSDQTNGDIEIRWTDVLPTWASLDFDSSNQLYKPSQDSITGISKLGANTLLIYGTDSISRLIYYSTGTTTFAFNLMVDGQGCASHHSIVNAYGSNWFFNKNYGFVRYSGNSNILPQDVISNDIEPDIAGIDSRYYDRIVGVHIPVTNEIAWAVPLAGATTPNNIMYYKVDTGQWRIEDKASHFIDVWTRAAGQTRKPVFANTDGHTYQITGETIPSTGNLDGYRIEPIMDFGNNDFNRVQEVWFGVFQGGNYSIDVSWRVGNTVKELLAQSWTAVGSVSLNNPYEPALRMDQVGKYHQMKWGSNLDSEKYSVNWIKFNYTNEFD